jgi:hypothetical protein
VLTSWWGTDAGWEQLARLVARSAEITRPCWRLMGAAVLLLAADFTVGPLLVPGLRSWAHARPDSHGHQFKVGVQVRRGQTATLVVPAAFHRVAGLQYAQQARSAQTPAEADHAVTFPACTDHHTPFIGGFFVLEPRCVPLEIRPAGGRPVREVISFFAGDCWPIGTSSGA